MIHIFLSQGYQDKLNKIARSRNQTKEQLAESILSNYLDGQSTKATPFELGRDLFGKIRQRGWELVNCGFTGFERQAPWEVSPSTE